MQKRNGKPSTQRVLTFIKRISPVLVRRRKRALAGVMILLLVIEAIEHL